MDSLNWQYYLSIYPDLRINGVNTEQEAIIHWNTFGKKEGRISSINDTLFNWQVYFDKYADLKNNGLHTKEQVIIHWNIYGKKEGRSVTNSVLVDWQYYLDKYPDLRQYGVHTEQQAIAHWRQYGINENRIPINTETIYEHIRKILYCQPIFAPDLMRLNKNIVSLESISNYLKKNNINIDTFNFIFGGWCINDDYWDIISKIIIKLFNTIPIRFDKNYGKAYVVNSLIKTAHAKFKFKYILTLDSDIVFDINEPNIFERLIYSVGISECSRDIPVGLISLNQLVGNCHSSNVYENNLVFNSNYGTEKLVYPNGSGGIAGGCLFITLEGWQSVEGYRVMGVYASDDAYLLIDLMNKGMSIQMADTIRCIHPYESDSTYANWKGLVCRIDQCILNNRLLEEKIKEADTFWSQNSIISNKTNKTNKIGILIPSTSNGREWNNIEETYLYSVTIKSFIYSTELNQNIDIVNNSYIFYIGIDRNDRILDTEGFRLNINKLIFPFKNIHIEYLYMDGIPNGHLTAMWNRLFIKAFNDGCDYFYQCGDDIEFKTKGWIEDCINKLFLNNDIGLSGCINNNPNILTQTFVSRKHYDLFGYYFPEEIINWYCDDWINEIYRSLNAYFPLQQHLCENIGGDPRYTINDYKMREKCTELVNRDLLILKKRHSLI